MFVGLFVLLSIFVDISYFSGWGGQNKNRWQKQKAKLLTGLQGDEILPIRGSDC